MALTSNSRLVIRASIGVLSRFGDLREIQIADAVLLVGSFEVRRLTPRPNLRSRIVTVKLSRSPSVSEDAFRSALHDKLVSIGITSGRLMVGQRRTMAVKRRQIVGYEVRLANLSPGDSLLVQENGIGGRRKMGAGVFHVT